MRTTYNFLKNRMHPNPRFEGLPQGVIFAYQKGCGTRKLVVH